MTELDCATIAQLSQSWPYNTLVFFKLLISVGGVAYLVKQWMEHGARFLGNFNSRVLFQCYYLMFIVHSSSIAVMYVIELTRSASFDISGNPLQACNPRLRFNCVFLNFWIVLTLRGLVLSTLLSSHIIFILMSFERLYSSLYPEIFEKSSGHRLTIVLAITVVASACFFVTWNLTNEFQISISKLVPIAAIRVKENADKYDQLHYAVSATNIFSMLVFFVDIYLNFYRKLPKDRSLGVSYQFAENRRIIRVLVPIEILDSICTISQALAQLLFPRFAKDVSPLTRQIFLESTTFTHAYPLILAIIIKWRVGRRRRVVLPVANAFDHFRSLKALWE